MSPEKYARLVAGVDSALIGSAMPYRVYQLEPYEQGSGDPLTAAHLKGISSRSAIEIGALEGLSGGSSVCVLTTDTMKAKGVASSPDLVWSGKGPNPQLVSALVHHEPITVGTATVGTVVGGGNSMNGHLQHLDRVTVRLKPSRVVTANDCRLDNVSGGIGLVELWKGLNGTDGFDVMASTVSIKEIPDVMIGAVSAIAEHVMRALLLNS